MSPTAIGGRPARVSTLTPKQSTVDVIIKRIAAAGADVASPWKQAYINHADQAFRSITDPIRKSRRYCVEVDS